jgi:hypothetical protein
MNVQACDRLQTGRFQPLLLVVDKHATAYKLGLGENKRLYQEDGFLMNSPLSTTFFQALVATADATGCCGLSSNLSVLVDRW